MISRLHNHFPNNWDMMECNNVLHVLKEISISSHEYSMVVEPFANKRLIKKVLRVQHPLAFLRYTLQGENLNRQGTFDKEVICYHAVTKGNLNVALDYNCDHRRYTNGEGNGFSMDANYLDLSSDKIIIVIKKRTTNDHDKNRYPLYVVYF